MISILIKYKLKKLFITNKFIFIIKNAVIFRIGKKNINKKIDDFKIKIGLLLQKNRSDKRFFLN